MATIPIVDDGDTYIDIRVDKGPLARIVTTSPTVRDSLVAEGFDKPEEILPPEDVKGGQVKWRFILLKTELNILPVKDVKGP